MREREGTDVRTGALGLAAVEARGCRGSRRPSPLQRASAPLRSVPSAQRAGDAALRRAARFEIVDGVTKLNGSASFRCEVHFPRPPQADRHGGRPGTISIRGPSRLEKEDVACSRERGGSASALGGAVLGGRTGRVILGKRRGVSSGSCCWRSIGGSAGSAAESSERGSPDIVSLRDGGSKLPAVGVPQTVSGPAAWATSRESALVAPSLSCKSESSTSISGRTCGRPSTLAPDFERLLSYPLIDLRVPSPQAVSNVVHASCGLFNRVAHALVLRPCVSCAFRRQCGFARGPSGRGDSPQALRSLGPLRIVSQHSWEAELSVAGSAARLMLARPLPPASPQVQPQLPVAAHTHGATSSAGKALTHWNTRSMLVTVQNSKAHQPQISQGKLLPECDAISCGSHRHAETHH